ncbi:MAG: PaaI family thioesterase [Polyangiales bacterium]
MTAPKPAHFWDFPPSVPSGEWHEKRRLAAAVRELIEVCVTTDASEAQLAAATATARALVDDLGAHGRRTFLEAFASKTIGNIVVFADRGMLVGLSNPMSPPMTMHDDGEGATAQVTFGPAYEGAPGCVHGGLIAAAFDQTLGFLNVCKHVGAMTASLTVHYRRPTPIQRELTIVARTARVEGKKRWVTAKMFAGGELTAEAEGLFIALDASKVQEIVDAQLADAAED